MLPFRCDVLISGVLHIYRRVSKASYGAKWKEIEGDDGACKVVARLLREVVDAGNPLHVQNSDNSNSMIIPFKLLDTKNYRIWSGAMKLALQAGNKFGFVDGSGLKEFFATSEILSAQWDR
ncbi:putative LTR copia-type gag-polypeptide [Tanacetum coccineum]